jgi:hypothetical protein
VPQRVQALVLGFAVTIDHASRDLRWPQAALDDQKSASFLQRSRGIRRC